MRNGKHDVFTGKHTHTHTANFLIFKEPLKHFATNYRSKWVVHGNFPLICKASLIHKIVHILLSISISIVQDQNLSLLEANNCYYFLSLMSSILKCSSWAQCVATAPLQQIISCKLGSRNSAKNIRPKALGCRGPRGGILVAVSKKPAHSLHGNREASKEITWNSRGQSTAEQPFSRGELPRRVVRAMHGRCIFV